MLFTFTYGGPLSQLLIYVRNEYLALRVLGAPIILQKYYDDSFLVPLAAAKIPLQYLPHRPVTLKILKY